MDTKSRVVKSIAMCFTGLLFVFVLTWIIFDFQKSSNSLKDTWSIVSALFGGFTTLLAAYIANQIFNEWKVQHDYTEKIKLLCEILDVVSEIQDKLDSARDFPLISELLFEYKDLNGNLAPQFNEQFKKYEDLKYSLHKLIKLENKIFLISNGGPKGPIFHHGAGYDAIQHLLKAADRLTIDASDFYEIISLDSSKGVNAKHIDFNDKYMHHLLMRLHRSGDLYLRVSLRVRNLPKTNIYTDKYEECLNTIDQAILNYRDVLEKAVK